MEIALERGNFPCFRHDRARPLAVGSTLNLATRAQPTSVALNDRPCLAGQPKSVRCVRTHKFLALPQRPSPYSAKKQMRAAGLATLGGKVNSKAQQVVAWLLDPAA